MRVVALTAPEQRSAFPQAAALPVFDPQRIREHAADEHLCAVSASGETQAYCSLWWNETPPLAAHKIGTIGHYASACDEAAAALLEEAIARLGEKECTLAVGPMDGNTWRSYRFATDAGPGEPQEQPFFMEPANPPEWPHQFERAGFKHLAEYTSALNGDLSRADGRVDSIALKLENAGVRVRSARASDLPTDLARIYQVSRIAFTRNFLCTELPEQAFLAQYTPLLNRIQPDLLLLAERSEDLVGYLFAIPDFAQAARGSPIDTFLIKTVAILPEPALRGLGGLLVERAHQAGRQLGFRRCIHALMHEDNVSRNISRHSATTMRRYTLFGREIVR
jgi:GNAT superfamily N-acetyltransferase